ncbi:hypothetical protein OSTOST_21903 [Ostertagia ostertagi]
MFADDSAIFAETDEEATNIMCSLSEIAQSYGLKINAEKTKYLGSVVQERKVVAEAEVRSRIGHASKTFAALKWCLWKKSNISLKTKIRMFRTLVLLCYYMGLRHYVSTSDLSSSAEVQIRFVSHFKICSGSGFVTMSRTTPSGRSLKINPQSRNN